MLSFYLDSLYRMLVVDNPLGMIGDHIYKQWRAMFNFRRNMAYVAASQQRLNRQYEGVQGYVEHNRRVQHTRLDVRR